MNETFDLPGYEILNKLGAGGMATVWRARQVSLDRDVAIKVLSAVVKGEDDIRRFEEEARSAAKLKHQGIVQVYDANVSGDSSYIVMEYISGYTVGEWVRKKGRLSEDDALSVAECVADALRYAWEREGLIHCDIKPDNVMVDGDGTVKVADLGLARTMRAIGKAEVADEILGTPAYISPEQAMGLVDLDCRADIYSLGAMLYHLLTGRFMFQGLSDDEALEGQVHGSVDDPAELNPDLSAPVCWLLERMLSKDRGFRQRDWDDVLSDIRRVRSGRMPAGVADLLAGASTIKRSPTRVHHVRENNLSRNVERLKHADEPSLGRRFVFLTVLLVVLTGGVLLLRSLEGMHGELPGDAARVEVEPSGAPTTEEAKQAVLDERVRRELATVLHWFREHPRDYDTAMTRLESIRGWAAGSVHAGTVDVAIEKIEKRREHACETVLAELREASDALVVQGEFERGAELLEGYRGRFEGETESWRKERAKGLRAQAQALREDAARLAAQAAEQFAAALPAVVDALLAGSMDEAEQLFRVAVAKADGNTDGLDCDALLEHMMAAVRMGERVAESFSAQRGSEVQVELDYGREQVRIESVVGDKITGRVTTVGGSVYRTVTFSVDDLTVAERFRRMGADDEPGVALVKGAMAMAAGSFDHAKRFYSMLPPDLSRLLVPVVDARRTVAESDRIERDLRVLLAGFGVQVGTYDYDRWCAAAAEASPMYLDPARVDEAVRTFRRMHGATERGQAMDGILVALERVVAGEHAAGTGLDPLLRFEGDFLQFPLPELGAAAQHPGVELPLPPGLEGVRDNPEEVRAALMRSNAGVGSSYIQIGQRELAAGWSGLAVEITTGELRDIDAVRALGRVRGFSYGSLSGQRGLLVSLQALSGLPLEYVSVGGCSGVSLSSLRGAPLRYIAFRESGVRDLDPIAGAPVVVADLRGTQIRALDPLVGSPLAYLFLDNSAVTRLEPLVGLPLRVLTLAGTRVSSFNPLEKLTELAYLSVAHTSFRDMKLLGARSLVGLDLSGSQVREWPKTETDESRERGPMRREAPARGPVFRGHDAAAFMVAQRFSKLEQLSLAKTAVREIHALATIPLERLNLARSRVEDLSALRGMPLRELSVRDCRIESLEPLRGLPLECLDIRGTGVVDLGVLEGMPLKSLALDEPEKHVGLIGTLTELAFLNGTPIGHE